MGIGICSESSNKRKINSNNVFKNLKNKYILLKIFDNILKKKLLEIIKYNKKIQKRINININDYKEYSEIYSSIEIKIIPAKKCLSFINFKEEDEEYYHIYFDNNKEEIKMDFLRDSDRVKKIKIIIDYQVKSFNNLFRDCYIKSISFKKFFRNNINCMSNMFYGCSSLKELNLNNFNTNNVKDMSHMFYNCLSLEK